MAAKRNVAIVTDSTSYIPHDLVEQYGLTVVPQILNWEGKSYLDGIDISNEEFYARLSTAKELPTIAQPSPGQFMEAFSQLKETADSIYNQISEAIKPVEILRAGLSPVVGVHAGPGAFGVVMLDAGTLNNLGR